jgi:hypothetical protein
MNKKITWIVVVIVVVVVAGISYWHLMSHSTGDSSAVGNQSTAPSTPIETTSTPTTPSTLFTSSSSAEVGKFTVVTDCTASDGQTALKQIDIFEGGNLKQTMSDQSFQSADLGNGGCPKPESRDINSDGYPDFSVVSNYGNQYVDSVYWIYNSSTDQFSCPKNTANNKSWMNCYLVEPL